MGHPPQRPSEACHVTPIPRERCRYATAKPDRSLGGDSGAGDELLHHACDRLLRLTRKMFHGFPQLRRWEQTDDVFQNSLVKLHRALSEVRVESVRQFFNLAAVQIRRELLDLAKHHYGPQGVAANHHTDSQPADDVGGSLHGAISEPQGLKSWNEFHLHVEKPSHDEQEIINLVFYEGLFQEEAANVVGMPLRTFKWRWQAVKVKLSEALRSDGRG